MGQACRGSFLLLPFLLLLYGCQATPHVDDCNFCQHCVLGPEGPGPQHTRHTAGMRQRQGHRLEQLSPTQAGQQVQHVQQDEAAAEPQEATKEPGPPAWTLWPQSRPRMLFGAELGPAGTVGRLIQPSDTYLETGTKVLKPNCTECHGCDTVLEEMSEQNIDFGPRLKFMHGRGASATWLFFAHVLGSRQRYVVKIFCVPFAKSRSAKGAEGRALPPGYCGTRIYEDRVRSLLAQQQIMGECGAEGLSPKAWLAPLSATLPGTGGYHANWHALWMEEAQGITLHGLYMARADRLVRDLLQYKMNKTQVLMASVLDVLTAQCDRHSENVFITKEGQIQVIDNDKALGAVPGCGVDSMFIPGTRYHSMLRVGYWNSMAKFYRRNMQTPGFCRGPIDARNLLDYRCWTPTDSGELQRTYPAPVASCLAALARLGQEGIRQRYGLTSSKAVQVLHNRATDLMERGFEWTLAHGLPLNTARFNTTPQPKCCSLAMESNFLTCGHCWSPILDKASLWLEAGTKALSARNRKRRGHGANKSISAALLSEEGRADKPQPRLRRGLQQT